MGQVELSDGRADLRGLAIDLRERALLIDQPLGVFERLPRKHRAGYCGELLCLVEHFHDLEPAVPELPCFVVGGLKKRRGLAGHRLAEIQVDVGMSLSRSLSESSRSMTSTALDLISLIWPARCSLALR